MSGALDPVIQQEVIDRDLYATAVLSGNRNFDGRIHPYAKQAFLASPPLVIAYAIAGTVRFDIERDSLGEGPDGQPITLSDIWPSDEEFDAVVASAVKPEQFTSVYEPMFIKLKDETSISTRSMSGAQLAPTFVVHPTGRARLQANARCATCDRCRFGRQHHHRSLVAIERDPCEQCCW